MPKQSQRALVALLAALMPAAACSPTQPKAEKRSREPVEAASIVPQAASAPALPDLERARLEYLFAAAELVARDWPGLAIHETCILLVDPDVQWVVNCPQAPAGFEVLPGEFRERPLFAHAGSSFHVGGESRSTEQLLRQTPAAAHVSAPGGRDSGLPAAFPWLLLGTLEGLRAFHPAFGPATTEAWVSVAIHELVHIHQLRRPAFAPYLARIDSRALDPEAITALYARDATFHIRVEREYAQLVAAAQRAPDAHAARRALAAWLVSYRHRSAWLGAQPGGAELLQEERLFTYLEGVARFVESSFLANTSQHPAAGLADDPHFHSFEAFVGRGYPASPNRQLDPQYYYAIGYHLCVLLDRADPTWKARVDDEPGWLIGLVERRYARH